MDSNIFNGLNEQQKKAIDQTEGPSIILAGAGSGKTKVLVHKVVHLIKNKNINPSSIVMITFTNKAASEMKNRMGSQKLGYTGTFHSFSARVLRVESGRIGINRDFTIYDDSDQLSLIKFLVKKEGIKKLTPSFFLHQISSAKNEFIMPDRYLEVFSHFGAEETSKIFSLYQSELKKNSAMDFDDLLVNAVLVFKNYPEVLDKYQDRYRYFLIDEFQDTNYVQYLLTSYLARKRKNITIVGDFSQSIYSWRGADITNLEKLKEDFPETKVFLLEKNYRSTQNILDFAYRIISRNKTHPILNLFTDNSEGDEIVFFEADNEEEEVSYITDEVSKLSGSSPNASFAVLYRTNAQSRILEEAFLHRSIPYVLVGGTRFYERKEIKDVLSYLRLLANPDDQVAKDRVVKIGKKRWDSFKNMYEEFKNKIKETETAYLIEKVFETTSYLDLYHPDDEKDFARLENIKELKSVALSFPNLVEFLEQVALVESEYFEGERKARESKTQIKFMTLHQAKGLEFDYVFIIGVEEGILPHSRSIDDQFQLEEERRLFYVGITRAKKQLYITYTQRRFIFGKRTESLKSRFLMEDEW